MTFLCSLCDYKTLDSSNYKKHLKTRKHIKNEEQNTKIEEKTTDTEEKTTDIVQNRAETSSILNCIWCKRYFSRLDNLQRHMMMCRIKSVQKCPKVSNNEEQSTTGLQCQYCKNSYCNKRSLSKHSRICFLRYKSLDSEINESKTLSLLLQKENEIKQLKINQKKEIKILEQKKEIEKLEAINKEKQKAIDIAKNSQNITINHNKTINFLNNNYGEMIAMETFLKSLEHTHQLTLQERKDLLSAYNECGIDVFARNFSYIMKQNCKRQLESQGIEDMKLLPLFCSDGNLRSHKEKQLDGWKTLYDNQSINQMLNISNQQIHDSYQQIVPISGRERTKIYKEVKRDNHQNKLIKDI